jgi:hypothetical protein
MPLIRIPVVHLRGSLMHCPFTERYDADIPTLESFGQWWRLADP